MIQNLKKSNFQRTTTIIRVNLSKNNSAESQNLLAIPQITSTINSNFPPPQPKHSSRRESNPYICGLGARFGCERLKRAFKPQRLKSQICFIYLQEFVCFAVPQIRILRLFRIPRVQVLHFSPESFPHSSY